ncbi:MAG: amidohydrolase family protein [Polyangia bacterium]
MKKLRAACLPGLVRSICAGLLLGSGGPPAARAAIPATAPAGTPAGTPPGTPLGTPAGTPSVTIAAARLLDVDTGRYLDRPLVRIDGGTVTEVRQRHPGEPVTFDLGDQTLLPGLIDCHTHLVGGEEQTPYDSLRQTAARAAIEGVANARATLYAGFTTVRDLGSRDLADVALRDAISAGRIPGPRMFVAVSSVSSTGGHGDWNDLPPDVVVQRYRAIADGPDAIRHVVRTNLRLGADWIKVFATGGVTSANTDPQQADYSEEEIRVAVQTAASRGRDVAVHAHGAAGIIRAARAGVRSIEHASFLTDEAIAEIRRAGAFIVPNPYTNLYILERGRAGGFQDYEIEKSRSVYHHKLESVRRALQAGIPVAYGTDSGVQPHGLNARQLGLFVHAGMTPLQALQSATLTAARLLRQERRLGRLRPGYVGDVVAVPGDPLRDVRVVEAPTFVFKDGHLVFARGGAVPAELLPQAWPLPRAGATATPALPPGPPGPRAAPGYPTAPSPSPPTAPTLPSPGRPRSPAAGQAPAASGQAPSDVIWR